MNSVNRSDSLSCSLTTGLKVAGVVALVVGVAAIVFPKQAANYLDINSQRLSLGALGVSGVSLTTAYLSDLSEEDELIVDATGRILSQNKKAPAKAAPKENAHATKPVTAAKAASKEKARAARPVQALTAAEAKVFYPLPSTDGYSQLINFEHSKHPIGMVGPLCSIESAIQDKDQVDALGNYVYQPIQAKGDCFFIALISGLLHRMLANKDSEDTKRMIFELGGENPQISDYLVSIRDRRTLIEFLNNKDSMKDFVLYMRQLAYACCENADQGIRASIRGDLVYADLDEVASVLADRFAIDLYITKEEDQFNLRTNREYANAYYFGNCYDRQTGRCLKFGDILQPIAIIYRNNHFDLLMSKDLIDQI